VAGTWPAHGRHGASLRQPFGSPLYGAGDAMYSPSGMSPAAAAWRSAKSARVCGVSCSTGAAHGYHPPTSTLPAGTIAVNPREGGAPLDLHIPPRPLTSGSSRKSSSSSACSLSSSASRASSAALRSGSAATQSALTGPAGPVSPLLRRDRREGRGLGYACRLALGPAAGEHAPGAPRAEARGGCGGVPGARAGCAIRRGDGRRRRHRRQRVRPPLPPHRRVAENRGRALHPC
jgi:hypothetical protein